MMQHDSAALRVLYIGGTGTISTSCVRLSVESGMSVSVLNRGNNSAAREMPQGVSWLTGDVTDDDSLLTAIEGQQFDAVVNFLSYDADDVRRMVGIFGSRTRQYVHISSASIYAKPLQQSPITESTPIAPNPVLEYATAKWRAEAALQQALTEQGFPVTIVRPSHTYDDANPPVPGGWTVLDRIARGAAIPVHGDGTSLWTLTHAEDFAQGLVGLLGNPRTIGEVFNITGEDIYTWDQIYTILANALRVEAKLVHVASDCSLWWRPTGSGRVRCSATSATPRCSTPSKIRRFVPGFAPKLTFHRAARRMVQWRAEHPETTAADQTTDAVLDRIVDAYHAAREVFAARAPQAAGIGL